MSRLIESIKFENGIGRNLELHESRMNRSRSLLFGSTDPIDLKRLLVFPGHLERGGLHRCRLVYAESILSIEWIPYRMRIIRTLRLVEDDTIDYSFKYEDRSRLDELYRKRDGCDEILIVRRGVITDTSFSNIAFFDGTKWFTPSEPLLRGTKRERLLSEGRLIERSISPDDLHNFTGAALINAFLDPSGAAMIQMESIFPHQSGLTRTRNPRM